MTVSSIEWLARPGTVPRTWNPVRGCSRVSPGCENCYAETYAARNLPAMRSPTTGLPFAIRTPAGPRWTRAVELIPSKLDEPLHWRKPSTVFVNSMSDLWHESLTWDQIGRIYETMARAHWHTFIVLTKRPKRRLAFVKWLREAGPRPAFLPARWPLLNVWELASVENQQTADERLPILLSEPAAVRGVSYEPALGAVNFLPFRRLLDWAIVGLESGPGARPGRVEWVRSTVRQFRGAGKPVFVKQLGANVRDRNDRGFDADSHTWAEGPHAGEPVDADAWPVPKDVEDIDSGYQGAEVRVHLHSRKGGDPKEWPFDLRVREFPA